MADGGWRMAEVKAARRQRPAVSFSFQVSGFRLQVSGFL
jgi:hypothetical protein